MGPASKLDENVGATEDADSGAERKLSHLESRGELCRAYKELSSGNECGLVSLERAAHELNPRNAGPSVRQTVGAAAA